MGSIFKGARNATEFGPIPLTRSMRLDIAALWIGRAGFAGRGLLWSSIGIASVAAAVEDSTPVGTAGAVRWLADNTVGLTFIIIALIGVASYAFWRFFEGSLGMAVDPDDKKVKQILIGRIVPFGSGIGYVAFGTIIILGLISNDDGTTELSRASQKLAGTVVGKVLFTIAGVILFGVAIGWLFRLGRGTFKYMFDHELLAADDIKWSKKSKREPASKLVFSLAYVGTPGRTILFLLLSILVFREAYDPKAHDVSTGFGNALDQLQGNVGGKILLGLDGILLLIFGIYSFFLTRYKKFLYYHPHVRALKQTQIITPPHISFTSKLKSLIHPNPPMNV